MITNKKKLDEIINPKMLESDLRKLLDHTHTNKHIHFDQHSFHLDSQNYLSVVFYIDHSKIAHILEYDVIKKRIIHHYFLGYFSDFLPKELEVNCDQMMIDDEYLYTLDRRFHSAILYKKSLFDSIIAYR